MKNGTKMISFLVSLCMLFVLAVPAFAGVAEELEVSCAVVRFEDGADVDALAAELEEMPGIRVRWIYDALLQGAAVEGTRAALAAVENRAEVLSVSLSRVWSRTDGEEDAGAVSNSLDVMRGEELAYDGDGMVVAVIDSGLYVGHETMQDYGIMDSPALNEEDIRAFTEDGGTDGRYISPKIPFAFDYSGNDRSVHTADHHGTHVAALAVGYAENEDGSVKFRGVAPAAQLLCMKVFPDAADAGASDADILKAMEDAYLLGADVVNLSLGTEGDLMEDNPMGGLYQEMILKLREAGIIVCCAAGNSGDALTDKEMPVAYPTADYTDYGTACIPAAYEGTVVVGAVNSQKQESGGGIVAGGEIIGYAKGVSDNEEEVLPDIDDLAGQELTYVMIGGVGTKSDFAGMDLTGCVAVVQRGEIYFAEKVNNAAEAGAVACLIYNNEPGAILPSVAGTTIPCALITQAAGEFLGELAEKGRGTLVIDPEVALTDTGEPLSMLEASSWGATSSLKLVPTLSAPGGVILSAISGGSDAYGYLSGTSMATPNASGGFAVVMQALSERGIADKKERADLAECLLMSTAQLVTDEEGTPLSPRRQGLGVIDLAAAVQSRAVIEDPVMELGDELGGLIRLSFTVRNLSEEELRFSVEPTVLTDAFGTLGDRAYNLLRPLDLTQYMTVSGEDTVTIKGGGRRTVSLTLRADPALLQVMKEFFGNGFFLEGYVTLIAAEGETLRAAFMGYHGDWEAAPVIEQVDFRTVMEALAEEEVESELLPELLGVNMWYNLVYLAGGTGGIEQQLMPGQNPVADVAPRDERIAMSMADSDAHAMAGYAFQIDLYTLRHAAHVIMVVSDKKTGEIYYVDDTPSLPRADFDELLGLPLNTGWFVWDGTDGSGEPLAEGTEVNVEFFAWTESDTAMQKAYAQRPCDMTRPDTYRWLVSGGYDSRREWAFPLTLDGTAPTVEAEWNEETGEVSLMVTESQFLAYVEVCTSSGETILTEFYEGDRRGESHELRFQLPDGVTDPTIYVTAADYASNTIGYRIELSASPEETRCAMAYFSDVEKGAWYHEAVDFVYENGLMDAWDIRTFEPELKAMRATVVEAIWRMAGAPEVTDVTLPFTDLNESDPYLDALRWAYGAEIVTGYSDTLFAGLAPVSRQQLAVMLYRAAQYTGETVQYDESVLDGFADSGDVADWAREAVIWAVGEGILSGDGAGNLVPKAATTRAQLARILMSIMDKN